MDIRKHRRIGQKRKPATTGRQPDDPTEEEIAALCLKIQESWGEWEFMQRAGKRPWSTQVRKPPVRYYPMDVAEDDE